MEYERIQNPSQGSNFSPRKLRAMLLGIEPKRNNDGMHSEQDECKDVSMVVDSCGFEFHKNRVGFVKGTCKPAPSKWDDAQKWIASPDVSRASRGQKSGRQCGSKVVMDDDLNCGKFDGSEIKREISDVSCTNYVVVESSVTQSAVNLSRHGSSTTSSIALLTPAPTVRSVSMRDMGTEMTPIDSQDPSRTGTPLKASTPARSPSSSRPTTPRRTGTSYSNHTELCNVTTNDRELSDKELQMKTRREIMVLGTQLGKNNIAAWANTDDEQRNVQYFQTGSVCQPTKDIIQSQAAAWEDTEKAKYIARFKEEEIKIQAWENHQKAKSEAEMRKIEVEVERMKVHAQDQLMSKLASMRNKAEEKRAAAEDKRNQQASKTSKQVDHIKRTGSISSSYFCWSFCC